MRQNISPSSLTVGHASFWGGCISLAIRTCGHLGYFATCPQPWSREAVNCKTFAWSLVQLLICRSASQKVDLMQQLGEKLAYLKPLTASAIAHVIGELYFNIFSSPMKKGLILDWLTAGYTLIVKGKLFQTCPVLLAAKPFFSLL